MKNKIENSRFGWYLFCLSVGGILGIVAWNMLG